MNPTRMNVRVKMAFSAASLLIVRSGMRLLQSNPEISEEIKRAAEDIVKATDKGLDIAAQFTADDLEELDAAFRENRPAAFAGEIIESLDAFTKNLKGGNGGTTH